MASDEELSVLFSRIGLNELKIKEVLKNKKVSASLGEIAGEAGVEVTDKTTASLLHALATLSKGETIANRDFVTNAIVDGRLKTALQVDAAFKYVKGNAEATLSAMEAAAGVGVEVTAEQVETEIAAYIAANRADITEKRYKCVPALLGNVKAIPALRWASPAMFKPVIDAQILALLGPKDERDVVKKEKKKATPAATATKSVVKEEARSMFSEGFLGDLHKAGENPQMYPELMAEHLKATGGRVYTRFPPEPNGYLHIGHSKAIMVNFGFAKHHNGLCYLRYDDTNPEAEEEQYFRSIKELVEWLGFEPFKITYSSDYFDQLYALAERLITLDRGYVCHCTAEEVKAQRGLKADGTPGGARFECPHRNRPVAESLAEFRGMKDGKYGVGEATLRMKQDITSPSPQMWDLVAYRVLNAPHHRTGDKWKIYPTYDFTHCLVDSFENISHSLCTTEFVLSRESYEWLCDVLKVYRPAQREYGRLNITGTVLSKRKIAKLVSEKHVRGWDDPRLFTLEAIRRRGVPPGAILSFINTLGVTTSTTNIQVGRFESAVRAYLDATTPRLMMLTDPIRVVLTNVADGFEEMVSIPYKQGCAALGERLLPFTKTFYIDRSDYRDTADADYFRLAPGQSVGLIKVPFTIRVISVDKDAAGAVNTVYAHYENDAKAKKPKTFIQWVPECARVHSPVRIAETRVQKQLFYSENPAAHADGYLADVNPHSEEIITTAMVEPAFFDIQAKSPLNLSAGNPEFDIKETAGRPETVRFQAMRVGYFCVDKESSAENLIFNRIVTLKEDSSKN